MGSKEICLEVISIKEPNVFEDQEDKRTNKTREAKRIKADSNSSEWAQRITKHVFNNSALKLNENNQMKSMIILN